MTLLLAGMGTALPPHRISQADAAAQAQNMCGMGVEQQRLIPPLYRRAGVQSRHSVILDSSTSETPATQLFYPASLGPDDPGPTTGQRMEQYELSAGPLAIRAARAALQDAELSPATITHLVTVSCSGFSAPGFDLALIRELDLSPAVARTHVGYMGCHGMLNALRVARAFLGADPAARVLVCAVELCTLHHQYGWNPDQIVANALFADGAAAVVAVSSQFQPAGQSAARRLADNGSWVVPHTTDVMTWTIRDHGYRMTLSPRVPEIIRAELRPWLTRWLAQHQLQVEQIAAWAIHPGGPRILQACGEALGLSAAHLEPSRQVLADVGNMSSPTIVFILQRLHRAETAGPCLLLGFGPGLTIEAALLL